MYVCMRLLTDLAVGNGINVWNEFLIDYGKVVLYMIDLSEAIGKSESFKKKGFFQTFGNS